MIVGLELLAKLAGNSVTTTLQMLNAMTDKAGAPLWQIFSDMNLHFPVGR